jgi:molybdenum cofactor biosynthesis enzyme MoaA
MSEAIGSLLESRMASIELRRVNTNSSSIEPARAQTQSASTDDIPEEIDALIDNKNYRNKFRVLIRQGHLDDLLELASFAREKKAPSRWFSVVTAKRNWQASLKFLAELRNVNQLVEQVTVRLRVPQTSIRAVYKACWRYGEATIQKAVTAAEIGRDPFRLFCWLCYSSAGRR